MFERNQSKYPVRPQDFCTLKLTCTVPGEDPIIVFGKSKAECERTLAQRIKLIYDKNVDIKTLAYKIEDVIFE